MQPLASLLQAALAGYADIVQLPTNLICYETEITLSYLICLHATACLTPAGSLGWVRRHSQRDDQGTGAQCSQVQVLVGRTVNDAGHTVIDAGHTVVDAGHTAVDAGQH